MQAIVIPPPSPHKFFDSDEFAFTSESLHHDFSSKLKIDHHHEVEKPEQEQEQEFSFSFENSPKVSLVTADEIFYNGKIRPLFPAFSSTSKLQGLSSLKTTTLDLVVEDSKEMCKKSNSTGFSKMLRFRQDLKQLRSYSNGKDAFVYLNPNKTSEQVKVVKNVNSIKNGKRKMASSPSASAHEKLYMMNRKRSESNKRRSFLPYKQQLFWFFTNMNGFSKNLHPF